MEFVIFSLFKNLGYLLLGILFYLLNFIYIITSFPLYLYKWLIVKIVAPKCRGSVGNVVCNMGQAFAGELVNPNPIISPRSTILVSAQIEGHISPKEICSKILKNWIQAENKSGQLKYPELQQFPEKWMGIIFWKQDTNFRLEDHIIYHDIGETGSCQFLDQLNEILMNAPWKQHKSPWEVHLVQNPEENSILILRMHHMMSDGFGIWGLFLSLCEHSEKSPAIPFKPISTEKSNIFKYFISWILFPLKLFLEAGYVCSLAFKSKTAYHIPDKNKLWHQTVAKAKAISVQKVKLIKSKFGVSFASVINSSFAAASGKMMVNLDKAGNKLGIFPRHMLLGNAVPKPNHPGKLTLHLLGVGFEVPICPEMDPLERLYECQNQAVRATKYPFPLISGMFLNLYTGQLACFAKFILKNRFMATGVSSFLASSTQNDLTLNGKRVAAIDFTAGLLDGVAGLGVMTLSYSDELRICATVEKGVMSKEELIRFLELVCAEIDALYELAIRSN